MAHGIGRHAGLADRPHYVYRCFNDRDELLYVGCTANLEQRFGGHRTQTWWFPQMTRFTLVGPFTGSGARRRAFAVESHLIRTEQPKFNGRSGRKPLTVPSYDDLPTVGVNVAFLESYAPLVGRTVEEVCTAVQLPISHLTRRIDRETVERMARFLGCRPGSLAPALSGEFTDEGVSA